MTPPCGEEPCPRHQAFPGVGPCGKLDEETLNGVLHVAVACADVDHGVARSLARFVRLLVPVVRAALPGPDAIAVTILLSKRLLGRSTREIAEVAIGALHPQLAALRGEPAAAPTKLQAALAAARAADAAVSKAREGVMLARFSEDAEAYHAKSRACHVAKDAAREAWLRVEQMNDGDAEEPAS